MRPLIRHAAALWGARNHGPPRGQRTKRYGAVAKRHKGDVIMAAPGENLRINGDRLWDSLMEMAK
ncbi:hypothetical protein, partial [Roseovarius gahaiensis]|uniref:hypothetical protein n=1 Tax=Roseovarius gahaiensis TaxID=2716691 RepID=UPI001E610D32